MMRKKKEQEKVASHSKRRSSRTVETVTGVLGVVKRTPLTEKLRADPVAPFPGRFPIRTTSEAAIASRETHKVSNIIDTVLIG